MGATGSRAAKRGLAGNGEKNADRFQGHAPIQGDDIKSNFVMAE
jgi:hypothetical protein